MLKKTGWFLFACAVGVLLLSKLAPAAFLSGYFSVEQTIVNRFPTDAHRHEVEKLAPYFIRWGLLKPARVQVEPGISFLLDPNDLVALDTLRTGPWQPEIWNALAPSLGEGRVMLDVGAHIGTFTFKGAQSVGRSGQVVAFEPNPETLKLLRDNVTANHAENVTVAAVACTDKEQTLHFFASPNVNTGASSLSRDNAVVSLTEAPREYEVRGRPIDAVVRELKLGRVDAIKVDIEGAETSAMRGADETLRRYHPAVAIEVVRRQLKNMGTSPEELAHVFLAAGYNYARPLNSTRKDWVWKQVEEKDLLSALVFDDPASTGQLSNGFHGGDDESEHRTVDQEFTVRLKRPAGKEVWVVLPVHSPGRLKVNAQAGTARLPGQDFPSAGEWEYRQRIPPGAPNEMAIDLQFHLDGAFVAGEISLVAK